MSRTSKTSIRIRLALVVLAMSVVAAPIALGSRVLAQAKQGAAKVDINTATQAELEALPGVGAATAKKIIAGRPFKSVADLAHAGVPAKTIDAITPLVTVGSAAPPSAPTSTTASAPTKPAATPSSGTKSKPAAGAKVDINSATQAELEALPGVGPATAKKIVAGRPYAAPSDLAKAGVPAKTIDAITPLVTVGSSAFAPATKAAPPPPPPAPATKTPTPSGTSGSTPPAATTPQTPPAKGMVWVNLNTKVYHKEGDRYYGNTKNGKFMTEADAIKAGYHAAKPSGSAKQ